MFRPEKGSFVGAGLQAGVEVSAALQADGSFSVELESEPGVMWVGELDWLIPGQETEPPERRARGRAEWPPFWPGQGGDISALMPWPFMQGVLYGFGPLTSWPWPVVYLDLADPNGVGVYGVASAYVEEAA